ncbi:MAG: hypothetical protein H6642_14300 [Caldilineaceae bacterium]|nr:hypothetical protein [Caldilineaceae bacterium]
MSSMLTIFSIPKSFVDPHIALIQRNAIQSWQRIESSSQIILFGDEYGVPNIANSLGIGHIGCVERNAYGTPLLNSVFSKVQMIANNPLLCYVNADIVLLPDFIEQINAIRHRRFMMTGRRMDCDLKDELNFEDPAWARNLAHLVDQKGKLSQSTAMDYFVFPRDLVKDMPPFAVGRPGWDNWFVYYVRSRRIPVIDATPSVMAVHQNHGYLHVKQRTGEKWEGPEAEENRQLMPDKARSFGTSDATYVLDNRRVSPALSPPYLDRKLTRQDELIPRYSWLEPLRRRLFWRLYHRRERIPKKIWRQLAYRLTP